MWDLNPRPSAFKAEYFTSELYTKAAKQAEFNHPCKYNTMQAQPDKQVNSNLTCTCNVHVCVIATLGSGGDRTTLQTGTTGHARETSCQVSRCHCKTTQPVQKPGQEGPGT